MKQQTIEDCVRSNLETYFENLEGEVPSNVWEMVIRAVERPMLIVALEKCQGNQTKTAAILGINRNTLRKKLVEYQLQ